MRGWSMGLAALGALCGAAGVALAAAGAHRGGDGAIATTAGYFLLFHAAAVMALVAALGTTARGNRLLAVAASLLVLGVALFSGELALHALAGLRPLPMAAPIGGSLMILGWLVAAVALPMAIGRRD